MSDSESKPEDIAESVIARSYTKGIYLYPTMLIGFIIYLVDYFFRDTIQSTFNVPKYEVYIATIWFVVFTFNFIVISFDFTFGKVFTIAVVIFAIVLVYSIVFPEGLGTNISITKLLESLEMTASISFYAVISLMILVIIIIDLIRTRFDYWEFESNRIIHHRGLFEREMSFSAQNSRVTTQTDDVFERILFMAGTIFVQDPDRHVWPIYNVFGANGKDKKIQKLLSVMRVRSE